MSGRRSAPRSPTTARGASRAATPKASRRCGASAPASSSTRPAPSSIPPSSRRRSSTRSSSGRCAGALAAVERFAAQGLALAVVSNWDVGLHEKLGSLASRFACVVTSAEVGAAKPDPAVFLAALERLGVAASRALHVGDEPGDEDGARAAGMRFRWAPL